MISGNYRNSLKEALQSLEKANGIIFDSMVNVEAQGDLKEWNSTVPEGEVHQFDFEMFKNSEDLNVQLLVKLLEKIGETYQSILNINSLKLDDEKE